MATDVNLGMLSLDELRRLLGQTQAATPSSQVGVSPYQQIMGRMPMLENPYASMSGGYNNFQGGYNPNMYSNAPRAIGQLGFGGGGGGGDYTPTPFDNMTDAQKAAYYAANPTMASVTRGLQGLFGNTLYGRAQAYFDPDRVSRESLIAMGVNPAAYQSAKESFRASEISDMNAAAEQAAAEAAAEAATVANDIDAISASEGITSGDSSGYSASDYGGYSGSETQSSGEAYSNFNGGLVSNVFGPDPAGPDEGAGYLQIGEYVIKKSAVKKYGQGLLDIINSGKIPAKKMKSLLG